MEKVQNQFAAVQLPYQYVRVPFKDQPDNKSPFVLRYYVNRVITNLTRLGFKHSGFQFTKDTRMWNTSWGRQYSNDEYDQCEDWQKINHYAGAFLMGRKDHLNSRMYELKSRVNELADFYPTSFLLPEQKDLLLDAWTQYPLWIVKPSASSRGRGIYLLSSVDDQPPDEAGIVQQYIMKPMLITNRKFDIRLYALVSSISPLKIWMHTAGLARFATHQYDENGSPKDLHMHLTNFSVNKEDDSFVRCNSTKESINDSKWSLEFFLQFCQSNHLDTNAIMKEFEKVTICTIIAGMCAIRPNHQQHIKHRHTSYEMYGIDIMLDENMKAHLIEINISPSMSGQDSELDMKIKYPLQLDLLRMARIIQCNCLDEDPCPGVRAVDTVYKKSITEKRRRDVEENKVDPWENPVFADFVIIRDYIEENAIESNFRLVYPTTETLDLYSRCFDKMIYQDIVFNSWIKMDPEQKNSVISTNWKVYEEGMKEVSKIVAEAKDKASK